MYSKDANNYLFNFYNAGLSTTVQSHSENTQSCL